jgi:hypothetical protein
VFSVFSYRNTAISLKRSNNPAAAWVSTSLESASINGCRALGSIASTASTTNEKPLGDGFAPAPKNQQGTARRHVFRTCGVAYNNVCSMASFCSPNLILSKTRRAQTPGGLPGHPS